MVLHGGPAYPSDYLWNLEKLGDEREIIFYDQSGCGRSDKNLDQSLWTVEHFFRELSEIRQRLQLDSVHLFGHSWGTMIAADYLLTKPQGVKSVIFASPCISIKLWSDACEKHLAELPNGYGEIIKLYEAMGNTRDPLYKTAQHYYHTTYECRIDPAPQNVLAANKGFNPGIYRHMWGANEYVINGTLKEYDRTEALSSITIPTLFTCGYYDSASPEACALYQSKISGAELKIFEQSSHMPHLEQEHMYRETIKMFLNKTETI